MLFLGGNEVKSSAVVKYSSAPPQAAFAWLQEKTDLKLPPANWLRESAKLGPAGTTVLGNNKKSTPFSRYVQQALLLFFQIFKTKSSGRLKFTNFFPVTAKYRSFSILRFCLYAVCFVNY